MVRSLWSAATGMNAQQTNVDTIANNLANVNTMGYKAQVAQFKSLLYQTLQTATTSASGDPKPTSSQVGLGVRTSSINSIFRQGALLAAEDNSFAIEGDGFFAIRGEDGNTYYTRNGDFTWATNGGNGMILTDQDGRPVLNSSGQTITLNSNYVTTRVTITGDGQVCYPDASNNPQPINGMTIGLYQFNNPGGLERQGNTLWAVTEASGEVLNEATNTNLAKSRVVQGYLEGSNVQVADEMVNLIVAQRAYEMNSKAITTSDEMMQTANNLKR